VKEQFLEIIEQHFLKLEKELLISLSGFMVCMLPSLEDQNTIILKKIESILQRTEEIVGTSQFYGTIWMCMLRTPRTRFSAIKYLEKKIPRDKAGVDIYKKNPGIHISKYTLQIVDKQLFCVTDKQRETNELKMRESFGTDELFYFFYPNKEQIVINALIAGMEEPSSQMVKRGVLDFLISHMPIKGNMNKEHELVKLTYSALLEVSKKDYAFIKKFSNWFMSHIDDEDKEQVPNDDPAIRAAIPAIINIFKHDLTAPDKNPVRPFTLLLNLVSDPSPIWGPIIEEISVDMIKFVKHYHDTGVELKRFKSSIENFFELIEDRQSCFWKALGTLLSDQIRRISTEFKPENSIEAIDLINFCLKFQIVSSL